MRIVSTPHPAAWAPWLNDDTSWLQKRDGVAVSWLIRQAQTDSSRLVVQGTSHANQYRQGNGPLAELSRLGDVATYRSPVGPGAIFAPDPDIRLLATAMKAADGRSVVATESPLFPLHGWAMAVGALNLATNEVTSDERTPEQVTLLTRLMDSLYNGWSHREVGRRATAYYMPKLVDTGMTYEIFVGSLLAIDPRHLDSNSDIEAMKKALPPTWAAERTALAESWQIR